MGKAAMPEILSVRLLKREGILMEQDVEKRTEKRKRRRERNQEHCVS